MVQNYNPAEQRATRAYRRQSWRTGATEKDKTHALRVALSKLPKRKRRTFLDEAHEGPSRRPAAHAEHAGSSSSDPILISDDDNNEGEHGDGDADATIDDGENETAKTGGSNSSRSTNTGKPQGGPSLLDDDDDGQGADLRAPKATVPAAAAPILLPVP
ncbi:uncharacterized protein PG986_008916 [Apiospora aurea]|uniref:Uncharacterized protein n=1 Tax=Apiospora aurea TaxID=335848 RepID=A0ABR1Q653_9PEZI